MSSYLNKMSIYANDSLIDQELQSQENKEKKVINENPDEEEKAVYVNNPKNKKINSNQNQNLINPYANIISKKEINQSGCELNNEKEKENSLNELFESKFDFGDFKIEEKENANAKEQNINKNKNYESIRLENSLGESQSIPKEIIFDDDLKIYKKSSWKNLDLVSKKEDNNKGEENKKFINTSVIPYNIKESVNKVKSGKK